MCGVFGWQGVEKVPFWKRKSLAQALSVCNDKRGGHSWGYVEPNSLEIMRGLGQLTSNKRSKKLATMTSVCVHTRWATHGEKTVENAHPFEFTKLIGMHNGVIGNHAALNLLYDRSFPVDSMHIFAHLNEGEDLEHLEGYGTIVFVNKDPEDLGKVFLGSFNGGDLSVRRLRDSGGVVWSSSEQDLQLALRAAGLWAECSAEFNLPQAHLFVIAEGTVYKTGYELLISKSKTVHSWKSYSPLEDWEEEDYYKTNWSKK